MGERYYYQHNLDNGQMTVHIPDSITAADCDDMEEYFSLIVKQARRRSQVSSEEPTALDLAAVARKAEPEVKY